MYTPFRLKPRIFPEVVSATVAASEAITRLRPQPPVADFVVEGGSGMGRDSAVARKITEPAKPAPKVAMRPTKERRSLKAGLDSRFGSFFKGRSDPRSALAARGRSIENSGAVIRCTAGPRWFLARTGAGRVNPDSPNELPQSQQKEKQP